MLYRRYPVAEHDSNRFKKISSRNINGSLYYKLQQVQKKLSEKNRCSFLGFIRTLYGNRKPRMIRGF